MCVHLHRSVCVWVCVCFCMQIESFLEMSGPDESTPKRWLEGVRAHQLTPICVRLCLINPVLLFACGLFVLATKTCISDYVACNLNTSETRAHSHKCTQTWPPPPSLVTTSFADKLFRIYNHSVSIMWLRCDREHCKVCVINDGRGETHTA